MKTTIKKCSVLYFLFGVFVFSSLLVGSVGATEPRILQGLDFNDYNFGIPPAQAAAQIIERKPGEMYVIGHECYTDAIAAALRAAGKIVYHYYNTFNIPDEAANWELGFWPRRLYEANLRHDILLRDLDGVPLRFRWFGNPKFVDWGKVDEATMDYLIEHIALRPGGVFPDQAWERLRTWMFDRACEYHPGQVPPQCIDDDYLAQIYNQDLYRTKYLEFVQRVRDEVGPVTLNGYWNWFSEYREPHLLENSNVQSIYQWPLVLEQWQASEENWLGLNDPQQGQAPVVWERVVLAVDRWVRDGGIIAPKGPQVTNYALEMRDNPPPPPNPPPTVAIISPSNGQTASGTIAVTVRAQDDESVDHVDFLVDDVLKYTAYVPQGGYYRYSWDTQGYSNGNHGLEARAVDNEGAPASHRINVNVQNAPPNLPPTVTIVAPSDGEKVSGTVSVAADAQDDEQVIRVEFYVDDILEYTAYYPGPSKRGYYIYECNTLDYTKGLHAVRADAFDNEDGHSSHQITVNVQNASAPSTTLSDMGPQSKMGRSGKR